MNRIPITYNLSPKLFTTSAAITGIGETTAVLRCTGDNLPGTLYAAVRTTAYASNDQAAVSSGTGAVWYDNNTNAYNVSFVIEGLTPGTVYWYGTYRNTGAQTAVLSQSFTTAAALPEETGGTLAPVGDE